MTTSAVELMDGVDFADIMVMNEGRGSRSARPQSDAYHLDAAQVGLEQGPCLAAATSGAMIRCADLREDPRWPEFAAAAVAAGVRSTLSFQLATRQHGAVHLFGRTPAASPEAETIGALLATLATVALMTADRQEQFETALASRDVIGQAKGILMNHFKIDATRAFEALRSVSQNDNTPLRNVAQEIIASY